MSTIRFHRVSVLLFGPRVKEARPMEVRFHHDSHRRRVLRIGGGRFTGGTSAVVNGVPVEIAGLAVIEHDGGDWQCRPSRHSIRRRDVADRMEPATDAARRTIREWAQTEAPRLAELYHHLFAFGDQEAANAEADTHLRHEQQLLKRLALTRSWAELARLVADGHTTERPRTGEIRFDHPNDGVNRCDLVADVRFGDEIVGYRAARRRNWETSDGWLVPLDATLTEGLA